MILLVVAYFIMFGLAAPFQQFGISTLSAAAMVSPHTTIVFELKWLMTVYSVLLYYCNDYKYNLSYYNGARPNFYSR